jgi:hypothetical protein
MPTPSNAPSSSTGGSEIQNAALFQQLTERQAMPQISTAISGLNKKQRLLIEKVGVISRVRLTLNFKFKTQAGKTPTLNPGFPWKVLREIAMQANGVTGIMDCSAATLQMRRDRVYRNPTSAIIKGPQGGKKLAAATPYECKVAIEIPIAHDMTSLLGSLLAQNEETGLSFLLYWASEEEIVNEANSIEKFEGEIEWASTVFSIGSTVQGNKEYTVLPDLSAFHGLTEQEINLLGTGNQRAELVRTNGQLLCYTALVTNKPGGQAVLTPEEWTRLRLEYGGNKDPLVWEPANTLWEENADDYNGPLIIGGEANEAAKGLPYLAIDQERDNAVRDMIIPTDLVELRAVLGIPVAFTPESARIFTSQETLYPAVTSS